MMMLTVFITMGCMMAVRADSLCHKQFMQSIQYQLKLFGDQSCSGSSHYGVTRIGFLATSSRIQKNVPQGSVVIFDKVLNNVGNGYNSKNGIFTAPVDGLYLFSWTIVADTGKHFVTFLELNGQDMGRNHASSAGSWSAPGTQTLVLYVKKSEEVLIKTTYVGQTMHGDRWSTFTGVLIA